MKNKALTMVVNVIMPKLGWVMERGRITSWLKREGEQVSKGEPLFEVETEKVTVEVEAPASGILRKILARAGSVVEVFRVVGVIGSPDERMPETEEPTKSIEETEASAGEQPTSEVEEKGQKVVETKTQAPRLIKTSPRARRLAEERRLDLSLVTGTGPGGWITERDVQSFLKAQPPATPLARRVAQQAGMDLTAVKGTGPHGRITKEDVERALAAQARPIAPRVARVITMTGVRSIVAERMAQSARTAAHVTLTTEADAAELVRLRKQLKEDELPISYDTLLVKIAAQALREFPNLNATLVGDEIHLLQDINIAVAVDTERGLIAPVVRDTDRKGLSQLEREIRGLAEKARVGGLSPDDLVGGTFTVTNLGIYEIDAFTPLTNPPQCAILGIGRIVAKPAVSDGEVRVKPTVTLSLSFDHRIVDGAPAARFLQKVKRLIEKPQVLLA